MLALLKDVPVLNHPVVRIVLGAALLAVGLAFHAYVAIAAGGLLLVMGIVRGVTALNGRHQKEQP